MGQNQMRYTRLGRRWRRMKGLRLNSSRLPVLRLRARFVGFINLLSQCLGSLKRNIGRDGRQPCRSGSRRGLIFDGRRGSQPDCNLRSCERSNSFYAEAIADCLEFIKRSSVSLGDGSPADESMLHG